MARMRRWMCAMVAATAVAAPSAQSPRSVSLHVTEAGGMRRTQFPVSARIPFPQGVLRDAGNIKLLLNQTEVAVQAAPESRWPDGSVQWATLDLNVTIGPTESQTYSVQYGEGVKSEVAARGLMIVEEADAIQIGNMRFSKSGSSLLASIKYRDEAIGPGSNGVVVTDAAGTAHDLTSVDGLKVEIVKRGPLVVVLKYSGSIRLDAGATAPFVLTVEMPNSKSWVKLSTSISDPARHVRGLAVQLPLSLGALPWVWDFGTTRWTYGSLRGATDSVVMADNVTSAGAEWSVSSGPAGREQVYETSRPDAATFAGWGHIQSAKEVVAYAIEGLRTRPGSYRIAVDGGGKVSFQFAPPTPQTQHELTVYVHFVSTPVQIGAATSPAAILSPLVALCDREQYVKSGVAVPPGVR
jgi:exo-rhamnogalacturonan lyase-like protein